MRQTLSAKKILVQKETNRLVKQKGTKVGFAINGKYRAVAGISSKDHMVKGSHSKISVEHEKDSMKVLRTSLSH